MKYFGSSDVFCYPEDDSVLDPLLAQHLAFFGIDFSSLQKVSYTVYLKIFRLYLPRHCILCYIQKNFCDGFFPPSFIILALFTVLICSESYNLFGLQRLK